MPWSVERVEREVFATLGQRWGHCQPWQRALMAWTFDAEVGVPEFLHPAAEREAGGAGGTTAGGILIRRLFDREADNHHEEPLLLAQLAARSLQGALRGCPPAAQGAPSSAGGAAGAAAAAEQLLVWAAAVVQAIHAVLDAADSAGSGSAVQLSALANQEEVYPLLLRGLLALWACAAVLRPSPSGAAQAVARILTVRQVEHTSALHKAAAAVALELSGGGACSEGERVEPEDAGDDHLLFLC
jgi:hypothetical protein